MKSEQEVSEFERLHKQLTEMHKDFIELSKKKPNDPVNKFKIGLVNPLLETANRILGADHKPFENFEVFKDDELPSNSDILLILTQYISCLTEFKKANTAFNDYRTYWVINKEISDIEA